MPGSMSRWAALAALALLTAAPAAQGRATASPRVCDDPPQTLCGSIDVPLDRAHPGGGTTPIFFALVRHTDPGRAAGTILAIEGGPGVSSTAAAGVYADVFGPLLDKRDLLTIDLCGTGRSAAIECPALQHGIGDFGRAVRTCGALLGASSSLFGTAERSDDIDDVRAALGTRAWTSTASRPAGSKRSPTPRGTRSGSGPSCSTRLAASDSTPPSSRRPPARSCAASSSSASARRAVARSTPTRARPSSACSPASVGNPSRERRWTPTGGPITWSSTRRR